MARAAVIVIGGSPPPHGVVARLPADRYVIAADSGLDHALALGLPVDALIGDLDSVSDAGRRHAERSGMAIHHFPPDKDTTDTELAIALAISIPSPGPAWPPPRQRAPRSSGIPWPRTPPTPSWPSMPRSATAATI